MMIIGECPYEGCDGFHMIPIADKTPAFSKEKCETCGREYWLMHSRINPKAFTVEEFEKEYIVDDKTKTIERRTEGKRFIAEQSRGE